MNYSIQIYKLKRILYDQRSFFVYLFIFICLFFVVFIFYARFNSQLKEVELTDGEVKMLKNRYDTLKYNKSLTENQIKEYNKLLASLVPETEDFFSIIYALDEISNASHFVITDYTIEVGKSTSERLTLTVLGSGNTDQFISFLQEYQFAGGRLATINKIQFGGPSIGSTKVALNFYNKRFAFNESVQVPQLSKEELAKLELIKSKVKFQFSSSGYQSVSTTYDLKDNPFQKQAPPSTPVN